MSIYYYYCYCKKILSSGFYFVLYCQIFSAQSKEKVGFEILSVKWVWWPVVHCCASYKLPSYTFFSNSNFSVFSVIQSFPLVSLSCMQFNIKNCHLPIRTWFFKIDSVTSKTLNLTRCDQIVRLTPFL